MPWVDYCSQRERRFLFEYQFYSLQIGINNVVVHNAVFHQNRRILRHLYLLSFDNVTPSLGVNSTVWRISRLLYSRKNHSTFVNTVTLSEIINIFLHFQQGIILILLFWKQFQIMPGEQEIYNSSILSKMVNHFSPS